MRHVLVSMVLPLLLGCETMAELDRQACESFPVHPVTGAPVANLVPEEAEIRQAHDVWSRLAIQARAERVAVDPPGPRLNSIRSVFERLVAVAHRRHLPWEVHLVQTPDVNAFTPGGGMVVVLDGLFGGLVPPGDDDALAAVLAHEIAHVTMLHVPQRASWMTLGPLVSNRTDDAFYAAAYTTDQEAEADELSLLYLALAGFDVAAPARVWTDAHRRQGSSAARYAYLHDHPLNAERTRITTEAAVQVVQYWIPGQRNPDADAILLDNVLYPPAPEVACSQGGGFAKAAVAAIDVAARHEQAKSEAEQREDAAALQAAVRIGRVWEQRTADGHVGIYFEVQNLSPRTVTALQAQVSYLRGQSVLAADPSCGGLVVIPARTVGRFACYKRSVPGANQLGVSIVDASFQ